MSWATGDLGGLDTTALGERLSDTLRRQYGHDVPGAVLVAVLRRHFTITAETGEAVRLSKGTGEPVERVTFTNYTLTGGN